MKNIFVIVVSYYSFLCNCTSNHVVSYDKLSKRFIITDTTYLIDEYINTTFPFDSIDTIVVDRVSSTFYLHFSGTDYNKIWVLRQQTRFDLINEYEIDLGLYTVMGFAVDLKRLTIYFTNTDGLCSYNIRSHAFAILCHSKGLYHIKYDSNEEIVYMLKYDIMGTILVCYNVILDMATFSNGWRKSFNSFDIDLQEMSIYVPQNDGIYYGILFIGMFDHVSDYMMSDTKFGLLKLCDATNVSHLSFDGDQIYFVNGSSSIYRYDLLDRSTKVFRNYKNAKLERVFTWHRIYPR